MTRRQKAIGFFITPALLGGGKVIMIAEYVYLQMTQTAQWGSGAAICTILLITVGLLLMSTMDAETGFPLI